MCLINTKALTKHVLILNTHVEPQLNNNAVAPFHFEV